MDSSKYLIHYGYDATSGHLDNLAWKPFIKGGILDGNNICCNLLGAKAYLGLKISEIKFRNFKGVGLTTRTQQGMSSAEMICTDLYFQNLLPHSGSKAILNNGYDNHFTDIIIMDVEIGIEDIGDGIYTRVHHWMSNRTLSTLWQNSTFALINSTLSEFNSCNSDTVRYSFNVFDGKRTKINNQRILFNTTSHLTNDIWGGKPAIAFDMNDTGSIELNNSLVSMSTDCVICKGGNDRSVYKNNRVFTKSGTNVDYGTYYESAEYLDGGKKISGNVNLNDYVYNGVWDIGTSDTSSILNLPKGAWGYGQLIVTRTLSITTQMYVPLENRDIIYIRIGESGSKNFRPWTIINTSSINTYTDIQSVISNTVAYSSVRFFIPLTNANKLTINLTSVKAMIGNATNTITSSCTIDQKYNNGFVVKITDTSVAGGIALCSFTTSL